MNKYTFAAEIEITLVTIFIAGLIMLIISFIGRKPARRQISSEYGLACSVQKYDIERLMANQYYLDESVLAEEMVDPFVGKVLSTKPVVTVKYNPNWKNKQHRCIDTTEL